MADQETEDDGKYIPKDDDWIPWTCPKCRTEMQDPYKIKETCCSVCDTMVTLGGLIKTKILDHTMVRDYDWHPAREVIRINGKWADRGINRRRRMKRIMGEDYDKL